MNAPIDYTLLPQVMQDRARGRRLLAIMRENRDRWLTDPENCVSPDGKHHVTDDNPMMTGRCLNCRAFVLLKSNGYWRICTVGQATRYGKLGARR
jgi:hypothetical protein